jgi:hypothetical protein
MWVVGPSGDPGSRKLAWSQRLLRALPAFLNKEINIIVDLRDLLPQGLVHAFHRTVPTLRGCDSFELVYEQVIFLQAGFSLQVHESLIDNHTLGLHDSLRKY